MAAGREARWQSTRSILEAARRGALEAVAPGANHYVGSLPLQIRLRHLVRRTWSTLLTLFLLSVSVPGPSAASDASLHEDWEDGLAGWETVGTAASATCARGHPGCSIKFQTPPEGYEGGSIARSVNVPMETPTLVAFDALIPGSPLSSCLDRLSAEITLSDAQKILLTIKGDSLQLTVGGTSSWNYVMPGEDGWARIVLNIDPATGLVRMDSGFEPVNPHLTLQGWIQPGAVAISQVKFAIGWVGNGNIRCVYYVDTLRHASSPPTPVNLEASRGNLSVPLQWQPPAEGWAGAYVVYRDGWIVGRTSDTRFDPVVSPDTWKEFQVAAEGPFGPGFPTPAVGNRSFKPPGPPTNISVARGAVGGSIDVSWSPPSDYGEQPLVGYQVEFTTCTCSFTSVPPRIVANQTSYTIAGLSPSTTYYVRVRAYSGAGASGPSDVAAATTHARPSPPRDLVVSPGPGEGTIQLSWSPPTFTDGLPLVQYPIFRRQGACTGVFAMVTATSGTTYSDVDLPTATSFCYIVAAETSAGLSTGNPAKGATTYERPATPSEFVAHPGPSRGSITLTWIPGSAGHPPEVTFEIARGSSEDDLVLVGTTTRSNYSDGGFADGAAYWYSVRAVNAAGPSAWSAAVRGQTPTLPGPIQELRGESVPGTVRGVRLSWRAPAETGGVSLLHYSVYDVTVPNAPKHVAHVSPDQSNWTSLSAGNPVAGTHFAVASVNVVGESARATVCVVPWPSPSTGCEIRLPRVD